MKRYDVRLCKIIKKTEIADGFFDFLVEAGELAQTAQVGQFGHIKVTGKTLRRPISICEIDKEKETLRFVFQIRGEGTAELAKVQEGENLDVLAPLGTSFPLFDKEKKALLVGGGIGTPPLLGLAQYYGANSTVGLGFRNADSVILEKDFAAAGAKVLIATDDGSAGFHGLVTEMLKDSRPDVIYTCGPTPMLNAVCRLADEWKVPCYVSLEERMACAVGACLGCAVALQDESGNVYNGHVCKSGPIFDYKRVVQFAGGETSAVLNQKGCECGTKEVCHG
ncbi:dihydroorotate dehydrogenase electron transfer subunit [Scatolibacter rhodanostii]|uniref:dihydroorotate dehydrogenase electron transfer subunit n=1 Tax=Scatolibacter rhodanostii TaxID=2014781 RepID=UPI000C07017F|nr:dihydroorotate dehydrogenase electron transfer subunit [Scatolibacter rhodanostii]